MTGKVAIITGGAGGIGVVYAEALGQAGASVVVADVNARRGRADRQRPCRKGSSRVGRAGGRDRRRVDHRMAATAVAAFGGIDILVNNAAIMTNLPPFGLSQHAGCRMGPGHDVNLRGPLLCTQAVIESMTERGGGRIVNGLSAGAFMAGGIYGVSKYALHGLTCNLASELGGRGINVNAIAPGLVDNDSGYASLPKDSPFRDAIAAAHPRQEVGAAGGSHRRPAAAVLHGG